jgi:hypothetical protein
MEIFRGAVNLLHLRKWKAAASKSGGWRKVSGEAMARKLHEVPYKKKNYEKIQWINIAINIPMPFTRFV